MNFSPFTSLADASPTMGDIVANFVTACINDPIFIFMTGIVLLALFIWYMGAESDRVKRNTGTLFLVSLCSFCLISLFTNKIRLGIDINGGVSFTLEVKPNIIDGKPVALTSFAMEQACNTINERLNATGANEVAIMPQGENKILIQIPVTDKEKIDEQREIITKIAHLELLPVHPHNDQLVAQGIERTPGWDLFIREYTDDNTGQPRTEKLFLSKRSQLSGKDIKNSAVDYSRRGYVNVVLSQNGADKMWAITNEMVKGHDRLAIVLDGKVVSAPVVQSNLSKSFSISGLDGPGEAEQLVKVLSNPLTNEIVISGEQSVSAVLGHAALAQGETAGVVGLLICFVFMLTYYRFAGLVAIFALIINAIILLGCMSMFGFVLTLPGIAGIILTLGVAIDANVLIYERLREEKESGRPILVALRNSFDKAFSAIFDSNITSLITAVILFYMSSGSIKGFAVTLTVGIISSMIGALVGTRVLFYWAERVKLLNNMNFLNLFKNVNRIDFMGKRKIAVTISIILAVAAIASGFIKQEQCLGIDFTGGASITYNVPMIEDADGNQKEADVDFKSIEHKLKTLSLSKEANVQEFKTPTEGTIIIIRCGDNANENADNIEDDDVKKITSMIAADYSVLLEGGEPSIERVGALLGKEFLLKSVYALIAGIIGMLIYLAVRYEWSFAAAALLSTVHDVILVLGILILSGGQMNIIHVGAILTIAGYSINDTIIIFDRIREQLRFADPDEDITRLINDAINSTLSRTILTSTSTMAALASLYFFGGPALQDFSITILIGVAIGTYSSIYIAPPAIIWFSRKRSVHDEIRETMEMEMGNR